MDAIKYKPENPKNYEITLVRHGETDFNVKGAFLGQSDDPLNENGKTQAQLIGDYLRSQKIEYDLIITSPLRRAQQTAKIIQEKIGSNKEIIPETLLRERNYGIFEGKTPEELVEEVPELLEEYNKAKPFVDLPNGETIYPLEARIFYLFWQYIPTRFPGVKRILAVTHLNPIRAFYRLLGFADWDIYFKRFKNTSVNIFRTDLYRSKVILEDYSCAEDSACSTDFY